MLKLQFHKLIGFPIKIIYEFQDIGKALLPLPVTSKSLPAPAEAAEASPVQKAEAAEAPAPVQKAEAVAGPAPEINPVAKQEVKTESLPAVSRPLSPYPYVILTSMSTYFLCFLHPKLLVVDCISEK